LDDIDLNIFYAGRLCWDEVARVKRIARTDCIKIPHFARDMEKYRRKLKHMAHINGLTPNKRLVRSMPYIQCSSADMQMVRKAKRKQLDKDSKNDVRTSTDSHSAPYRSAETYHVLPDIRFQKSLQVGTGDSTSTSSPCGVDVDDGFHTRGSPAFVTLESAFKSAPQCPSPANTDSTISPRLLSRPQSEVLRFPKPSTRGRPKGNPKYDNHPNKQLSDPLSIKESSSFEYVEWPEGWDFEFHSSAPSNY